MREWEVSCAELAGPSDPSPSQAPGRVARDPPGAGPPARATAAFARPPAYRPEPTHSARPRGPSRPDPRRASRLMARALKTAHDRGLCTTPVRILRTECPKIHPRTAEVCHVAPPRCRACQRRIVNIGGLGSGRSARAASHEAW